MRLARPAMIAAAVLIPALAIAKQVDPVTYAVMELHAGAHCDAKTSPWRPWCIVDGFRTGTAAPLPAGKQLVGFTVEIAAGADVGDALANKVTLCALSIAADHKVDLIAIAPSNDAERALTTDAIPKLAAVFKGEAKLAVLPDKLTSFITAHPGKYAATSQGTAWAWTGRNAVELAKVGDFWIAIELGPRPAPPPGERHPPYGTVWVSVLTDAWK